MDKVKIMRKMDKDGLLLCDLQGNAFELSIQLTSTSSEIFMRRFMNSKVAKMIDNESILQMNIQPKDIIKRVEEEYKESHLDKAINIPVDEISKIEMDKDTILFVYCKSGVRSKQAAETLIDLGYIVYDLGAYKSIDLEE